MNKKIITIILLLIANGMLSPLLMASHSCGNNSCDSKKVIVESQKSIKHKCFESKAHHHNNGSCDCIYCYECKAKYSTQINKVSTSSQTESPVIISYHLSVEQKIDCLNTQSPHILSTLDYFVKTIRLQI